MTSYKSGLFAEFLARMYLRMHGFRILKSRYITGRNTGRAEIDIIARRGNLIIFCEVKKRRSIECAFEAISTAQAARLRFAAENYISRISWKGDARFDVITLCGWKMQWFQNVI